MLRPTRIKTSKAKIFGGEAVSRHLCMRLYVYDSPTAYINFIVACAPFT